MCQVACFYLVFIHSGPVDFRGISQTDGERVGGKAGLLCSNCYAGLLWLVSGADSLKHVEEARGPWRKEMSTSDFGGTSASYTAAMRQAVTRLTKDD